MRFTVRISAGGHRSLTRIPFPAARLTDCLNASGKIDRVKAQLAFAGTSGADGWQPFTAANTDDEFVYFAALTFLDHLHDAYEQVVENPAADCHEGVETRQDERLEAKMGKGRFVYVRNDIRRRSDGVAVRVTVANPFAVVGESEVEARTFAATCLQLWQRILSQVKWLTLDGGNDAALVAAAAEKNLAAEDRRVYGECERRRNGYCSPCKTDCKFYRDGRCRFGMKNENEKPNQTMKE